MAVVISSDESTHFAPGLRRSHSQPKFGAQQTGFRQSASASRISDIYHQTQYQQRPDVRVFSGSPTVSSPPSPRSLPVSGAPVASAAAPVKPALTPSLRIPDRIDRPGYGSSPNGTDDGSDMDAVIDYSHYEDVTYFNPDQHLTASDDLHGLGDSYAASPNDNNTVSTGPSRTNSSDFEIFDHIAEDDTAVRAQPSRHVDYLSHNWKEEDIWESWKYVVSRRGDYSNSERLENASWRTWMKSKNNLKTVTPETLNWLKDCDVTWLYGPLQTGHEDIVPNQANGSASLTKSNSFLASNKKPILKKRSMSEIMLQRSLSASSLVKQAAAAVQAQQKDKVARRLLRPRYERAATDYATFPLSSRHYSPGTSQSASSSGIVSPSSERKRIHFNEQVEQCIVVEVKGEDDDDDAGPSRYDDDSDSDDGAIMMKRTIVRRRVQTRRRQPVANHCESKTIAMLPSTTLKAQDVDSDVLEGSAMKHSYRSPVMSPSSSQETLRPSKPSGRMFFGVDDDDEDDEDDEGSENVTQVSEEEEEDDNDSGDDDMGFSMGSGRGRTGGLLSKSLSTSKLNSSSMNGLFSGGGSSSSSGSTGGMKRTTSASSLAVEPAGMRRTASGMFMPYDEGEPADDKSGGLVGRIIDTVNTARDIVHVIWNVGWRR